MKLFITGLTLLIILSAWLYIDFTIGRKKQLAINSRTPYPIRDSEIDFFLHGHDLFEDFFHEIRAAKKHIHICFYIVQDDQFSKEFISLLTAKAKEGVEVRLLVDKIGSKNVTKEMIQQLEAANGKFAYSHVPQPPFYFYTANVRNHRKMTVIDGKVGYMGGYNVGKEYIDLDSELSPCRDYHLKLKGKVVHDLQEEFLKDWRRATKTTIQYDQVYFPELEAGSKRVQLLPSEGSTIEDSFIGLIRKAKNTIFIGSPYFIPSKSLFSELLAAHKRGVKITILVPHKADHPLVQEASYRYLRRLIREGVDVYQFMNGFYHAKIFMIDDEICDIGTANFDKRSFFLNYEINCFIYDQKAINEVKNFVNKDVIDSEQLTLKDLNEVSLWTRVKEAIARVVSPLL